MVTILAFMITISLVGCDYIHEKFSGSFLDKPGLNVSMFIFHFSGIVFYGIDSSNNKVLIEIEDEYLVFNFNKKLGQRKTMDLCK